MNAPDPEVVIVVDELDQVIGYKNRTELIPSDCWRMTAVWIRSAEDHNRVLIAKRAPHKDRQAGLWVAPVNGTVPRGEDYAQTIKREIHEELGVADAELELGPKQSFTNPSYDSRICQWFIWDIKEGDEKNFHIDTTEIAELKWMDLTALDKDIKKHAENYAYYAKHFFDLFGHWQA